MKKQIKIILLSIVFLLMLVPFVSCGTASDPMVDDMYTKNIYVTSPFAIHTTLLTLNGIDYTSANISGAPGIEIDPVFTGSPAFSITAANVTTWNNHPPLTTGTHGVTGTIVGTSDIQALTNKDITMNNSVSIFWKNTLGALVNVIELWADDNLHILDGGSSEIFFWLGSGTTHTMYLWPTGSTNISTTKDSPTLDFVTNYWDTTNKNWEAKIIHNMITAGVAPKSRLEASINGVNVLRLENDNGVVKTYSDGSLDMTTHQINNVVDPTLAQDAATKNYVDNNVSGNLTGYVPYTGATGNVNLGSQNVTTTGTTTTDKLVVTSNITLDNVTLDNSIVFDYDKSLTLYAPLWRLYGGATTNPFISSGLRPNLLTPSGTTLTTQGRNFNGTTDRIALPASVYQAFSDTSDFTIVVWFKTDGNVPAATESIISFVGNDAQNKPQININITAGGNTFVGVRNTANTNTNSVGLGSVPTAGWHNIILTHEAAASNKVGMDYDNANIGYDATNDITFASTDFFEGNIGAFGATGAAADSYFAGSVGEVLIYNKLLTPTERSFVYNTTKWRYP